jgi:hypothetical protein
LWSYRCVVVRGTQLARCLTEDLLGLLQNAVRISSTFSSDRLRRIPQYCWAHSPAPETC